MNITFQPERRVAPKAFSPVDPMQKQDEDFMRVWMMLRASTEALGAGRPLICEETLSANRNHEYTY